MQKRASSGSRKRGDYGRQNSKPGYRAAAGIKGGIENGKGGKTMKQDSNPPSNVGQQKVSENTDREVTTTGGAKIVTYTNVNISGTVSQRGMSFADMLKAKSAATTTTTTITTTTTAPKERTRAPPVEQEHIEWAAMSEEGEDIPEPPAVKNASRISTPIFEPAAPRDVHVEALSDPLPASAAWASVVGGKKKEKEEKLEEKREERGRSARGPSPTRQRSRSAARQRSPSAARAAAVYAEQDDKVVLPFDMQLPKKDIFSFSGNDAPAQPQPLPDSTTLDQPAAVAIEAPVVVEAAPVVEATPTPPATKKEKKKKKQSPPEKEQEKEPEKEKEPTKKRKTKAEKKAEKKAAEAKPKEEPKEDGPKEQPAEPVEEQEHAAEEEGKISKDAIDAEPFVPKPFNRANWGLALGETGAPTNHLAGGMQMGQVMQHAPQQPPQQQQQPPPQQQQQPPKPKQEGGKGGKGGKGEKKVFNRSGWGTNPMEGGQMGHPSMQAPGWGGMDYRQQFGNPGTALGSVISTPSAPNGAPQQAGQAAPAAAPGAAGAAKGGKKAAPAGPTPSTTQQSLPTVTGQQLPWSTWAGAGKAVEGKQLPGNFSPTTSYGGGYYPTWNNGVPGMNGWAQQQQMYLYYQQQQQMGGGMQAGGYAGGQTAAGNFNNKQPSGSKKQNVPKPAQAGNGAEAGSGSDEQPRGNWGTALSKDAPAAKKQGAGKKKTGQKPKN